MTIYAAADGSALGNPGPAGWGWYVDADRWASGGWPHGTNNMGELKAVLDLLEQTAGSGQDLHIYCDSQYVINSVTKWMAGWKRNGWRKKDKSPVLNVDLMQAIDAALTVAKSQGRTVDFEWVKGHAGHEMNEEADRLAQAAAAAHRDGKEPAAGPGWMDGDAPAAPQTTSASESDTAAPSPPKQTDPTADAVEVSELELGMAGLPSSRLGGLLHPDWSRLTAAGRVQTRESVLRTAPGKSRPQIEITETATLGPDAVLIRSTQSLGGRQAFSVTVWVRTADGWQQRFQQFTSAG